jgi:GNAT superfamily N-acetyltransferase
MAMRWRAMRADDVGAVHRLSLRLHPHHPEDLAVFAERLALYPRGCRVLAQGEAIGGYLISHPWPLLSLPALNTLLVQLPPMARGLHLHDIATDPASRGKGHASDAVAWLEATALDMQLGGLGLVAVNGTEDLWRRFGFGSAMGPPLADALASYGPGALYMTKTFSRKTSRTAPRSPSSGSRPRRTAR